MWQKPSSFCIRKSNLSPKADFCKPGWLYLHSFKILNIVCDDRILNIPV